MKRMISTLLVLVMVLGWTVPFGAAADSDRIDVTIQYNDTGTALSQMEAVYSDRYFAKSSYHYNHDLAWLTLGLELSAWTADLSVWGLEDADSSDLAKSRYALIGDAYRQMGFQTAEFYNYGISLNAPDDKVAFSIATKPDVAGATLVCVAVRGGGYGAEWSSNFNVGDGSAYHDGFHNAAQKVYEQLLSTLDNIDGAVKLWLTGYSRGAAVANLLAAKLDDYASSTGQFDAEDVFAYTFATPQGVTSNLDTGNSRYDNIFNIVNPGDVVPMVAPTGWGFTRYGTTCLFDRNADASTLDAVNAAYTSLTGSTEFSAADDLAQAEACQELLRIVTNTFPDSVSSKAFQRILMDFLEFGNTKKLSDSGEWVGIGVDDYYDILAQRHGDGLADAQSTATWALLSTNSGRLLLALDLLSEDESLTDYVEMIIVLAELHGLGAEEMVDFLLKLLTKENVSSALFALLNLSNGLGGVAVSHTAATYLSWMGQDAAAIFGDIPGAPEEEEPPVVEPPVVEPPVKEDLPFADVKESDYFYDAVKWAYGEEITSGISDTLFAPGNPCVRAQVVTFLWRAEGCPQPESGKNPFVDVKPGEYYYEAVLWAVEKGITSGMDATHFGPGLPCTRGQVATFLWRAKGEPDPESGKNPFMDVKTKDYYYNPVLWAVENGITQGTGAGTFSPNLPCTRGQIVTFLYRAYQ